MNNAVYIHMNMHGGPRETLTLYCAKVYALPRPGK